VFFSLTRSVGVHSAHYRLSHWDYLEYHFPLVFVFFFISVFFYFFLFKFRTFCKFFFFRYEDILTILEKRIANDNRKDPTFIMTEMHTSSFQDGLRNISRGLPHVDSLLRVVESADLLLLDIYIMTILIIILYLDIFYIRFCSKVAFHAQNCLRLK
jgi:hypothetical protein